MLGFLGFTAIAIVCLRHLFAAVMLTGIYSLLSAALFVDLDAVDVAFTEAAVGAGISVILMLGTLALTRTEREARRRRMWRPAVVVGITGAALIYGTYDLPHYGSADAPAYRHVAPRYIEESPREIGIPNMVTSVLASYRGYDTLGEVTVIFTAGVVVMSLIGRARSKTNSKQG